MNRERAQSSSPSHTSPCSPSSQAGCGNETAVVSSTSALKIGSRSCPRRRRRARLSRPRSRRRATIPSPVPTSLILALAARDGVILVVGGPTWEVTLGRKDSRTPSQSTTDLPIPDSSLATLISMFANKNLTAQDMTALSGAHTIGRARCQSFRNRIYKEKNIDRAFADLRKETCPRSGGDTNLAPFDVQTADLFDSAYYQNLLGQRGLLHSDQVLFNGDSQDALVRSYSTDSSKFFSDFASAMMKMGNLLPSGTETEIRLNCRVPNTK